MRINAAKILLMGESVQGKSSDALTEALIDFSTSASGSTRKAFKAIPGMNGSDKQTKKLSISVLWYLGLRLRSKHMTGERVSSSLISLANSGQYNTEMISCKDNGFMETNQIGNVTISRTDNGTEFVNQTLREYYEKVGISHEISVARSPQQNSAKAVATACYTQNRSMIHRHHGKTPYKLLHDKPPDLSYLHVFGALCYPTNDSENLGKLQPKADIGIFIGYAPIKKAFRIYNKRTRQIIETIHVDFDELTAMDYEHSSSGPVLHEMTHVSISSGLVPNPPSSTPFVPPSISDWDLLFQPMFDESFNPPPYVDLQATEVIAPIPEAVAPEHAVSTSSPSSTTVDQDALSPSNSPTTQETQSPIISHDVMKNDNHEMKSHIWISQSPRGIFINQSKYALESLKKYGFESCDPVVITTMVESPNWMRNKDGESFHPSTLSCMICTLLYLTALTESYIGVFGHLEGFSSLPNSICRSDHAGLSRYIARSTSAVYNLWVIDFCELVRSKEQKSAAIPVRS
ncbi:retrovirus-related pol polyprotein from transposon TNT 1-94 [Tanacetum coccineum]|uniref:Retrovirus-related pol polyprotein from transposon TNT 1-94 n=1 Tax=Tanacetum coccineum TaxID=301880 RepID=A0ABQ4ZZ13_9ASTR